MSSHPHFFWSDLFQNKRSRKANPILHFLSKNILFHSLSPRELAYVSTLVYERIYQPGEAIFQQNDRGLGMYIIMKGKVAIKTETPDTETLITTLGESSFFGEIALVEQKNRRSASAIALERCVILGFFKPDLLTIMDRNPAMGVKILFQLSSILSRRLVETTEKVSQLLNQNNGSNPNVKIA